METPYHSCSALSNPLFLTVVRYYDPPCLSPSAWWDMPQPLASLNSTSGYNGWVDNCHIWLMVLHSFTNEGCCSRGCCTSWWSIFMLCRTFFIDLNHVMVLKLCWYSMWHVWRCDKLPGRCDWNVMKPLQARILYTVHHMAKRLDKISDS